jgi:hypothetical protein
MALLALLLLAAQADAGASSYRLVNPKAIELFERDPRLMDWALAGYDKDSDGYLSIFEADNAAQEFKRIADGDKDGQVTPAEYSAARDFIVARYVPAKARNPRM